MLSQASSSSQARIFFVVASQASSSSSQAKLLLRHCEECSDVAIHEVLDCRATLAMTSLGCNDDNL